MSSDSWFIWIFNMNLILTNFLNEVISSVNIRTKTVYLKKNAKILLTIVNRHFWLSGILHGDIKFSTNFSQIIDLEPREKIPWAPPPKSDKVLVMWRMRPKPMRPSHLSETTTFSFFIRLVPLERISSLFDESSLKPFSSTPMHLCPESMQISEMVKNFEKFQFSPKTQIFALISENTANFHSECEWMGIHPSKSSMIHCSQENS